MKYGAWLTLLVVLVAGCAGGNNNIDPMAIVGECPPEYNTLEPIETEDSITWKLCGRQFAFEPISITGKVGKKIIVETFQPDIPHSFVINEFDVDERLPSGDKTFEFTPDKAGEFDIICSVPGHKEAGMVAILIIEE